MDFFLREYEPELNHARDRVASFVSTARSNLVLVDHATFGMNVVAGSFPLEAGDNVLLNNHEYGAVQRIWQRACGRRQAEVRVAQLPGKFESKDQIIDCLLSAADERTKLVVFSHITSPTALILPAAEISSAFRQRGISVCIDGPHAPAHVDLDLQSIGCDFYTASCHKWLSAGLGSGFLFVDPRWHDRIEPLVKSWGRLLPAMPESWDDEFTWSGTRDPSGWLSIPTAIDFLANQVGLDAFRERTRYLATQAEHLLCEEFGTTPIGERARGWYGAMAHVPLPHGDFSRLQQALWEEYQIEVPIIHFDGHWFVRVSCHLYNSLKHLETLRFALRKLLL
jgi:isopenicillin-N epimerase